MKPGSVIVLVLVLAAPGCGCLDVFGDLDLPPRTECEASSDCTSVRPCMTGMTCDTVTLTCLGGTPRTNGYLCGTSPSRMICLDGSCEATRCGDGFVDAAAGEACEPPGTATCDSLCRRICQRPEDCPDDAEPCNGTEYCDIVDHVCAQRDVPAVGTECGSDPRRLCIGSLCRESLCGDGYVDPVISEECDDGNSTAGDGCEPGTCLFSCHNEGECAAVHGCATGVCDLGTHACIFTPLASGTVCRPYAGPCDIEDRCNGTGLDCSDEVATMGLVCRESTGPCDAVERCDGTNPLCPDDGMVAAGTACNDSTGVCDPAETCDGVSSSCPADVWAPDGTECRPAAGTCDLPETCNGVSTVCPPDLWKPEGDGCDDGDICTTDDRCDASHACGGTLLPALHSVVEISLSYGTTCAVLSDGELKCWGHNESGQLGTDTPTHSATPLVIPSLLPGVSHAGTGRYHACAVLTTGAVRCWGENGAGQLGNGTTTNSVTPVDVSGGPAGAALSDCGWSTTCSAGGSGGLWCWGDNSRGQLGIGSTAGQLAPAAVSGIADSVFAISLGYAHTCAIVGGGVKCWGGNESGQLGDLCCGDAWLPIDVPGLSPGVSDVDCGSYFTCAIMNAGEPRCWGSNLQGQLGDGTTTDRHAPVAVTGLGAGVLSLSAGDSHACAVTSGGGVRCWGDNEWGQLGDGTTVDSPVPVDVVDLASGVAAVAAGAASTCALLTDGSVRCWGFNGSGELGDGTTLSSSVPTTVVCR